MTITERNQLIENYLPLALKLACEKKKSMPRKVDFEDLKSAAYFGLVDAAQKYNPSKSSFGTYARFRIAGEIQDFIRESYRDNLRYGVSLDQPDENGNCMAENIADESQETDVEFFEDVAKKLNDLDKSILKMYYVDEMSMKEIGCEVGVSESRVSQLLKRTRDRIRNAVAA
jgi:RNA polymerase sigma factor for flagellar operon FliA